MANNKSPNHGKDYQQQRRETLGKAAEKELRRQKADFDRKNRTQITDSGVSGDGEWMTEEEASDWLTELYGDL